MRFFNVLCLAATVSAVPRRPHPPGIVLQANQSSYTTVNSDECQNWCAGHPDTWRTKCAWDTVPSDCGGCEECSEPAVVNCKLWCDTNLTGSNGQLQSWHEKCAFKSNDCSACTQCAGLESNGAQQCQTWCEADTAPWATKCTWMKGVCSACSKCDLTPSPPPPPPPYVPPPAVPPPPPPSKPPPSRPPPPPPPVNIYNTEPGKYNGQLAQTAQPSGCAGSAADHASDYWVYMYVNLGIMPWDDCVAEASRYGASVSCDANAGAHWGWNTAGDGNGNFYTCHNDPWNFPWSLEPGASELQGAATKSLYCIVKKHPSYLTTALDLPYTLYQIGIRPAGTQYNEGWGTAGEQTTVVKYGMKFAYYYWPSLLSQFSCEYYAALMGVSVFTPQALGLPYPEEWAATINGGVTMSSQLTCNLHVTQYQTGAPSLYNAGWGDSGYVQICLLAWVVQDKETCEYMGGGC